MKVWVNNMNYYIKIWFVYLKNSLMGWLINRTVLLIFLFGKLVRYVAYFGFLYFLLNGSGGIMEYNQNETFLFTATFVLVDVLSQFLFRNVYSFKQLITTGDFDLVLVKPVNALFRSLMGNPDPIDLVTIPPIFLIVIYLIVQLSPPTLNIVYYIFLILNGLLISAAFHIFVLGLGIITTEVDNTIMAYRDISSMARFPIDIYGKNIGAVLTYLIPIGVMITIPVKSLIGDLNLYTVLLSIVFGGFLFFISLKFWNFALKKYTSASS